MVCGCGVLLSFVVEYKDYYKSLGVAKSASKEEIRSSFRRLARQYHPDVTGNEPKAEERFKEINEAYEVLSDPEKRRKYDALGNRWSPGRGGTAPRGWPGRASHGRRNDGDFDFGGTGFSDFFEQYFGSEHAGFGKGTSQSNARGMDVEADIMVTLEEVVRGSVRAITVRNRESHAMTKQFKIKVPKGVLDGQKLRLTGKGEVGQGGVGDLYLRVKYASHPDFRVTDGHLHVETSVAPWDAVLGACLPSRTLGSVVQVRIPPGTQSGQILRLKSKGLPQGNTQIGDLYIHLKVLLPKSLNQEEKRQWEVLRDVSSFVPGNDT
jgi:curved DNA-binding protein